MASAFCFVEAEDKEDAIRRVQNELDVRLGGLAFYDGYEVLKDTVRPLSDLLPEDLDSRYSQSQDLIQHFREEAELHRRTGYRHGEAAAMRRASDLLWENMCPDMPWFNLGDYSYYLPEDSGGWWAVMVEFYY